MAISVGLKPRVSTMITFADLKLTKLEKKVVRAIVNSQSIEKPGVKNKMVADALGITVKKVSEIRKNLYKKLPGIKKGF